jgi:hypothetical protein
MLCLGVRWYATTTTTTTTAANSTQKMNALHKALPGCDEILIEEGERMKT